MIAIDGPGASGKTVVGREVAQRLGFRFLDTGLMYRAATWAAIRDGIDFEDEASLTELTKSIDIELVSDESGERLLVDGQDVTVNLRERLIDTGVSLVSKVPGVRCALVQKQREVASQGSIVMVGRDIGTVVLPDADAKVFLVASPQVRAKRRHMEQVQKGENLGLKQVKEDLGRRDEMDSQRETSPLVAADDAIEIVTDELTINDVVEKVLELVEGK